MPAADVRVLPAPCSQAPQLAHSLAWLGSILQLLSPFPLHIPRLRARGITSDKNNKRAPEAAKPRFLRRSSGFWMRGSLTAGVRGGGVWQCNADAALGRVLPRRVASFGSSDTASHDYSGICVTGAGDSHRARKEPSLGFVGGCSMFWKSFFPPAT